MHEGGSSPLQNRNTPSLQKIIYDKFSLLTNGLQVEKSAVLFLQQDTLQYGYYKGIAGGIDLVLPGEIHVSAPIKERYVINSLYSLSASDSGLMLNRDGLPLYHVEYIQAPCFFGQKNADGVEYSKFGRIYTDRLGISVVKGCKYALKKKGCRFCEIATKDTISLNSLSGVKELITYCENEKSIDFKHILLTGGSGFTEMWKDVLSFIEGVASYTTRPIYYMTTPLPKIKLQALHNAGVAEIGMNIEFWDRALAKEIMPGKGEIPKATYLESLKNAVEMFGSRGEVRSLVIVGLESMENTLLAVDTLSRIGVMPILSPFRALEKTPMQSWTEPDTSVLYETWEASQSICEKHGMTLGPLCKACQNNTVTAPVNDTYRYY